MPQRRRTGAGSKNTQQEQQEAVTFAQSVAAGASGRTEKRFTRPGRVRHVQARIYPGAELDLELNILVVTTEGTRRKVVETEGKDHIDGDNDSWEWWPDEPIQDDEDLVVEHNNTHASNSYDYRVNCTVNFVNGSDGNG